MRTAISIQRRSSALLRWPSAHTFVFRCQLAKTKSLPTRPMALRIATNIARQQAVIVRLVPREDEEIFRTAPNDGTLVAARHTSRGISSVAVPRHSDSESL